MITKQQYLLDPCRTSSIPYWKTKSIAVPSGMVILHDDEYKKSEYHEYVDDPYFRLIHDLEDISDPILPKGYSLTEATPADFVTHINSCYDSIGISETELIKYTARPVYNASLWLAVKENQTGNIVATGIAELDREIGEGALEWIQVSKAFRGRGLGRFIVCKLLWRMNGSARFVTVSGQCSNKTNPEKLYRRCGFQGSDVWHILKKRMTNQ